MSFEKHFARSRNVAVEKQFIQLIEAVRIQKIAPGSSTRKIWRSHLDGKIQSLH